MPSNAMCDIVKGVFNLLSALWLIADMIFDVLTTKAYYDAAVEISKTQNPFHSCFMYGPPDQNSEDEYFCDGGNHIQESAFFFASISSMLLPIPIGMITVIAYKMQSYMT